MKEPSYEYKITMLAVVIFLCVFNLLVVVVLPFALGRYAKDDLGLMVFFGVFLLVTTGFFSYVLHDEMKKERMRSNKN